MNFLPKNMTVWTEIPVADLQKGAAFYAAVTGATLTIEKMEPNDTAMFQVADMKTGVAGHLYAGKPAAAGTGPTVHLAIEGTVEQAMARCRAAGGTVVSPVIEIPAGRFVYAMDPDGNSIGLFEQP